MTTLDELLNIDLIHFKAFTLTLGDIFSALFILLLAWGFLYLLKHYVLRVFYKRRNVPIGQQFAINQLLKYITYPLTILLVMQSLGIELSVFLAGAAALMVGVGLGLQQTFKDLFSGIILLIEGTVKVDDVLEIDSSTVVVREIGLRTSIVETRDEIVKILPNSKLVEDTVVNWSHNNRPTRFQVELGVAFGSDLTRVKSLLLQAAGEHPAILPSPEPTVQFREFGNSALGFRLLFYSYDFLRIDVVKSDLRFRIDDLFRLHSITIPFPQQEIWFRNDLPGKAEKVGV
ncbi:mechanosensitive ion channel family protein [Spirosoma rigui]|uniref:mechanosensitive ion channel family protein n=1 Tax=Spirosoma rigui TaxID=564064 RepID=UPI0009B097A8|nr:mechanosensitive ion channel domain-containing protein [Spirosoma rigui]